MQKIYTKIGDQGQTRLANNQPISKTDQRVIAYGSIDELISLLGVAKSMLSEKEQKIDKIIFELQDNLMKIAASLSDPEGNIKLTVNTKNLEQIIDDLSKDLPDLKNFILPGGSQLAAMLQYARTVARRAEREVIKLHQQQTLNLETLKYLNRLSDLLFTLALWINKNRNIKEDLWPTK